MASSGPAKKTKDGGREFDKGVNGIVKKRLLSVIREVRTPSGWKVLIVDALSVRVISYALRMTDIMEEGVTLVEKLEIRRQPMPNVEGLYVLSPTEENINFLKRDFADEKKPQYSAVHVYFTSHLSNELVFSLKQSPALCARIRTLRELNLQFLSIESHAYTLDIPEALHYLHSPACPDERNVTQQKIVDGLLTVAVTLSERPVIRFKKGTTAETIARQLDVALDAFEKQAGSDNPWYKPAREQPSTLVIVDRSEDPLSPLLHEYTYQAMIYDLLEIKGERYVYKTKNAKGEDCEKEVFLNERDPLWPRLRHLHIADAINTCIDDFNKFTSENKAASMAKGGVTDMKQMSEAIRSMPQYTELLSKYSMHMELTKRCMTLYESLHLEEISTFEQNMAVGFDVANKKVEKETVFNGLLELLAKSSIQEVDKVRLIMIYVITQEGVVDAEIDQLVQTAAFKFQQIHVQALQNLKLLGVEYKKAPEKPKTMVHAALNKVPFPFLKGAGAQQARNRVSDVSYDLSRYRPPLQFIMQDALDNKLESDKYESIVRNSAAGAGASSVAAAPKGKPGAKAGWADKGKSQQAKAEEGNKQSEPRMLVFVNGGLCYSELRASYELSKKYGRDVIIGSTEMINPSRYVDSIHQLHNTTPVPKHDAPNEKHEAAAPHPTGPIGLISRDPEE